MTSSNHTVRLASSGRTFSVEPDESVLTAALRQGIILPYGCKNGACGSCKADVVEGTVTHDTHSAKALTSEEASKGKALLCCAHAQSDLLIECRELVGASNIPIRKMPVRVSKIEKPAADVAILTLQLPANERLQYLAGQYIEIILKDGKRRAYSLASAPHLAEFLTLHIRHLPGGIFTDHVFQQMKEREILRFEGPFGSFFLNEESSKPIILLASGTGFAPIKALIEQLQFKQSTRKIHFYWGARQKKDLYLHELATQWSQELDCFEYTPVLSESANSDNWIGRTGLVHQAVMTDYNDLSTFEVYACGAPVMVESARKDFGQQRMLPENAFFADAFTSEADLQTN
ncbi:CDP-6-deoxy-delta-3,4-glucoseen reductase [Ampullimonas aquatilis]|uniref:CDP-6-deoxy-delta-3,4-glucoseen reductase n=1 Tax=Ampullimonas aquatilis TaxID=1341549 RepID=UPI003C74EA79